MTAATALEGHDVIGLAPEYSYASEEPWLQKHGRGANVAARVTSQLAIRAAIRAGIGIGILECYNADRDPELVRIWKEPVFTDTWWMVVHSDLRQGARIRAVMNFLIDLATTQQHRLMGIDRKPLKGRKRTD